MTSVIAFIGAGKMASALIGGLLKVGHSPENIWVSCPTKAHLDALQMRFGVCVTQDNAEAVSYADILVVAVKPHQIAAVLTDLRSLILTHKPLLISVAASVSEVLISAMLDQRVTVIRAMPNTPALIGHGMTVLYAKPSISDSHKHQAEAIFQAIGKVLWIDHEEQMNAVTALSGSGPAYFFMLMEALEKAGIALGLPNEIVHHLVVQTAIGSAHMAAENTQNFSTMREEVTSPGGGTASAVGVLESREFVRLMLDAVTAAKMRFDAMGNITGKNKC